MLHSMTGFGAAHHHQGARILSVEARSVNHRFCDVRLNLPRDLESLSAELEADVRGRVRRGRVDVAVIASLSADAVVEPVVDEARARGIYRAYQRLATVLERPLELPLTAIAQSPGVMRAPEVKFDASEDAKVLKETIAAALDALVQMRRNEGLQLGQALERHLDRVEALRLTVVQRIPRAVEERQAKLRKRVDELLGDRMLDEARLAQEVAVMAERADVTEETERLDSHVLQFRRLLDEDDAVGRKMDFLIQEMNREANTIGSKGSDAEVAHLVVDLKAELERLREQVQNVE